MWYLNAVSCFDDSIVQLLLMGVHNEEVLLAVFEVLLQIKECHLHGLQVNAVADDITHHRYNSPLQML